MLCRTALYPNFFLVLGKKPTDPAVELEVLYEPFLFEFFGEHLQSLTRVTTVSVYASSIRSTLISFLWLDLDVQ